jgi:hypothetical protein
VSRWDNADSQPEQLGRTVSHPNPSTQIVLISFDWSETAITTICFVIWYGEVGQGGACGNHSTFKRDAAGAGFSIVSSAECSRATGRDAPLAQVPTALVQRFDLIEAGFASHPLLQELNEARTTR